MLTTQKLLEIVEILQLDLLTKVKVAVCVLVLTVTIIDGFCIVIEEATKDLAEV